MPKETIRQTIGVAAGVCVVCSVLVSTASVSLKARQDRNKTLEKRTNIVRAAGLYRSDESPNVDRKIEAITIDYSAGN